MPKRNRRQRRRLRDELPPLPLGEAMALNQQLGGLTETFRDTMSQLRLARAQSRSDFRGQLADLREARRENLAEAESAAIERGVLGSSTDYETRADVRGDVAKAITDVRSQRESTEAGHELQKQVARRSLDLGLANIQAARAAAQTQQSIGDFTAGRLPSMDSERGGASTALSADHQPIQNLLSELERTQNSHSESGLINEMVRRWKKMNRRRRRAGLKPESMRKLRELIRQARAMRDSTNIAIPQDPKAR